MRFYHLLLAASFITAPAMAADEFGARFQGETPAALEEPITAPQDIEPAAGDGQDAVETELEEKFQTEVESTTYKSGDGQTKSHDSVGEGDVRLFYQNKKDERVMDDKDVIGVELKLLEFN